MKLKEIPISLYKSWYLNSLNHTRLMNTNREKVGVVVSLTTIPSRLSSLHLVIRSLLVQSLLPERIVLWVHESLEGKLPKKLISLCGGLFEIRYTKGTASHRKLVHSLVAFPGSPIVTCDDDLLYPKDWLENLAEEAKKYPENILANQTRYIRYYPDGRVIPYSEWQYPQDTFNKMAVIGIGAGGVWYPLGALDPQVTDELLFMALAPRADDLWFKAASLLKGTPTKQTKQPTATPTPIIGSQKVALKKTNIGQDKNRTQWEALVTHFNFTTI
jgi:hypothetical protein